MMTTEDLIKLYQEHDLILIKFGAPWCGPCKAMEPVLQEIAGERPDLKIVELNVDEEEEMVQMFKVRNIPALFLVKCGVTINKYVGGAGKAQLLSFIDEQQGK